MGDFEENMSEAGYSHPQDYMDHLSQEAQNSDRDYPDDDSDGEYDGEFLYQTYQEFYGYLDESKLAFTIRGGLESTYLSLYRAYAAEGREGSFSSWLSKNGMIPI